MSGVAPGLALGLVCLGSFAAALAAARFGRGSGLDVAAFQAINRRYLPFGVEIVVRQISHLGLLPTNALIWATIWWWRPARGAGVSPELVACVSMVAAWATCRLVKSFVPRVRPHAAVPGARLVGLESSGSSFPSSHAALSVFTAVTVVHLFGLAGWQAAGTYALAAIVCYARIYFGAHYPSDVLAGAAIGLAWALVAQLAR